MDSVPTETREAFAGTGAGSLSGGLVFAHVKSDLCGARHQAEQALKSAKKERRRALADAEAGADTLPPSWLEIRDQPRGGAARGCCRALEELVKNLDRWRHLLAQGRLSPRSAELLMGLRRRLAPPHSSPGPLPDDVAPDNVVPDNVVPDNVVPDNAVPGDALPAAPPGVELAVYRILSQTERSGMETSDLRTRLKAFSTWKDVDQLAAELKIAVRYQRVAALRPAKEDEDGDLPEELVDLADIALQPPSTAALGLRLAVRRGQQVAGQSRQPVDLPLAPLTLVLGDNAAGKTTLAEALCLAHSGLPRMRRNLPPGSQIWRDLRFPADPKDCPPFLTWLQLRSGDLGAVGEEPGHRLLSSPSLLPLFADDADLVTGDRGDLSVATWMPIGSLKSLREERDVGSDLPLQLTRFLVLRKTALRHLAGTHERAKAEALVPDEAGPDLSVSPRIVRLFKSVLELAQEEASQAKQESDSLGTTPLEGSLDDIERDHRAIRNRRTRLPRALLVRYLEPLTERIVETYGTGSDSEILHDTLASLDQQLGGGTALIAWARKRLARLHSKLEQESDSFLVHLADWFFDQNGFERNLDRYLSQDLDPWRELQAPDSMALPSEIRPNTAAVVRLSQSSRLARWLVCGKLDWPFFVLDEPALGQDDASCARALVRQLRLMRRVEAERWALHLATPEESAEQSEDVLAQIECVELENLEEWELVPRGLLSSGSVVRRSAAATAATVTTDAPDHDPGIGRRRARRYSRRRDSGDGPDRRGGS